MDRPPAEPQYKFQRKKENYANYIHAELPRSGNVIYEYKCGLLLPELMPSS